MEEKLQQKITDVVRDLGHDVGEIELEYPADLAHGDYATNVALKIASKQNENPREIAEQIVEALNGSKIDGVEALSVAGPGFINITLTPDFFSKSVGEIVREADRFGRDNALKGSSIMVEYTDPNPFKEFHIGHLMSNTIGESIARLIESSGATVKRANYQGDVGMHVAKALWGMTQLGKDFNDGDPLHEKVSHLGKAYALGANAFNENEEVKSEIQKINANIYNQSDEKINKLYSAGREASLAYFESIYKKLGTEFDFYFFESEAAPIGKELVHEYVKKGVFEESEGAYVFPGDKHGLHTRVFLNSDGLPTYEAKELALAQLKYERFKYNQSLVVTGNEIDAYFKVLLKAMEEIYPELAEKTQHIGHGMMRLADGKMSSRTGDVVTFESLYGEVYKEVEKKMAGREMAEEEKHRVSHKVSIAALKYSILKNSIGKDAIFDLEKAINFEGDSGPYLQYSYVRARSIVDKATREGIASSTSTRPTEVSDLERLLHRFPKVVSRAREEFAPHLVAVYLTDIASRFNTFYAHTKVVDDVPEAPYYVALTEAVSVVLKNGLDLLGVETTERM